jgi:hypothetical protein
VNLAGVTGSTFSYGLVLLAGRTCSVLMSFGIAAINETHSMSGSVISTSNTLNHLPEADQALNRL